MRCGPQEVSQMMERVVRRSGRNEGPRTTKVPKAELDALIEEATVDTYNESEQMMGFHAMLDEHLDVPFKTEVLGIEVTVEKVDLTDDDQIVVVCTRGKSRHRQACVAPVPTAGEHSEHRRNPLRGGGRAYEKEVRLLAGGGTVVPFARAAAS